MIKLIKTIIAGALVGLTTAEVMIMAGVV